MIIVDCQQGTPEWLAARAGVITASNFRVARSKKSDGSMTEAAEDLAFKLALERMSGVPLDDDAPETWQMKRGQRLEPEARLRHEAEIGVRVKPVGIILSDDRKFGASADGWIGDDGGAEYKCLVSPKELRAIYIRNDPAKYVDQVMGNLWLSGRRWWDFCVYCPALETHDLDFYRQRMKRDEESIERMIAELLQFDSVVERNRVTLLRRQAARNGCRYEPQSDDEARILAELDMPF
ncbi:lambda exonuclease family protein [Burkholderia gladioli]|uniref:lambda exonuclease family protein n=1 Tax=Burkholderia gladioli TaxID=28095 RepID=UPI00163F8208|nr:lambda exonuclease family protein [Burkholderia gladioli]